MFDLALQDDVAEALGERTEWLRKHFINRALSEQADAARKAKAERMLRPGSAPALPAPGKPVEHLPSPAATAPLGSALRMELPNAGLLKEAVSAFPCEREAAARALPAARPWPARQAPHEALAGPLRASAEPLRKPTPKARGPRGRPGGPLFVTAGGPWIAEPIGVRVLLVVEGAAKGRDDVHGVVGGPAALHAPIGVDQAVKPVVPVLMTQEQHARAVEPLVSDQDPLALRRPLNVPFPSNSGERWMGSRRLPLSLPEPRRSPWL